MARTGSYTDYLLDHSMPLDGISGTPQPRDNSDDFNPKAEDEAWDDEDDLDEDEDDDWDDDEDEDWDEDDDLDEEEEDD
jgi:hypothetical protein